MHGLIGDPLTWAAVCGTVGGLLWQSEHHFQRFTAWLFALTAAFVVLAVPPWEGALAALLQTSGGTTVFIVLTLVFFVTFYLSAVRSAKPSILRRSLLRSKGGNGKPGKDLVPYVAGQSPQRPDRYHRVWTPVAAFGTGTLSVIVFGGWKLLVAAAGKSAVATGQQLLQSQQQINNGHAAASVPASSRPGIYIAAAAVLLVIVFLMRRVEKRRHGGGAQAGGRHGRGGPQMLGGGQ